MATLNNNYPTGNYVNILDGVAARLYFSNQASGLNYASSLIAAAGVVALSKDAAVEAVLHAEPAQAKFATDWELTHTEVTALAESGKSYMSVRVSYKGTALPAMATGARPAGWAFTQATPEVMDGSVITGFSPVEYSTSRPIGTKTAKQVAATVYFVPYFKVQAASTTPTLVDGKDQTWTIYLAKPLNSNQNPTFTITTPMFGGTTTLSPTMGLNNYGQLTEISVTVPLATKHPTVASNTIRVQASFPLTYLKGDTIVTETITYDETFPVAVTLTPDVTAPVIFHVGIMDPSQVTIGSQMLYANYNGFLHLGGLVEPVVSVSDAGTLDRIEMWVEDAAGVGVKVATKALTVSANTSITTDLVFDSSAPDVPQGKCRLLAKAYDKAGNVGTAYYANFVYISNLVAAGWVVSGTKADTGTNVWTSINAFGGKASHTCPAFFKMAKFILDGVALDDSLQKETYTWDDTIGATVEARLPKTIAVGNHTLTTRITDALLRTAENISYVYVSSTYSGGGSGGCVPDSASITMGDWSTRSAGSVQAGDFLMVRDPRTQALVPRPVDEVLLMGVQPCLKLTLSSGTFTVCSTTHLVFSVGAHDYVQAQSLEVGATIDTLVGPMTVTGIDPAGDLEVMTFSIKDPVCRNYFADGVHAHNKVSQHYDEVRDAEYNT